MTRHQRRKAAKERKAIAERNAIIQKNLSGDRDTFRPTGRLVSNVYSGGLHRNNAVPRKHRVVALLTTPEREAIVRLRVAPFYRDDMPIKTGKN